MAILKRYLEAARLLDTPRAKSVLQLFGRDRQVLAGAHPGWRRGAEPALIESLNDVRQTAA